MIILDATTRSLEVVLSGAVTTSQLPIVAHFTDFTTTTTTPSTSNTVTNNTTAVTAIAAPAASTQRQVKEMCIYNGDTATASITVRYNDNGTTRIIVNASIASGSSLAYSDIQGWYSIGSVIQGVKLDDLATPDDNTDLDVTTSYHGLCPKAPNLKHEFFGGLAAWAYGTHWDYVYELSSDFTITNALLQAVTNFSFTPVVNNCYEVVVVGASSGSDATGDVNVGFGVTGTALFLAGGSWTEGVHYSGLAALTNRLPTAFASTTQAIASPGLSINNGDANQRPFILRFYVTCNQDGGTFQFTLGNAVAAAGRNSNLLKGTRFMYRNVCVL